ncbi:hypothetical protein D9756_007869 [Leucocoprinus leucothites]|uniref:Protein kinase domain-containing protein n=1 Tax=Leucocoprinus leucothites TaxID=201217 RepID=A0A8H5FY94_9AGAR|nr:hypothetical protein D9756_007869 [Leucoagaricus leucothites]
MEETLGKVLLTADIWTDENLTPFIGVTAHWIEVWGFNTPAGVHCLLNMKSHMGWAMMDNATNNNSSVLSEITNIHLAKISAEDYTSDSTSGSGRDSIAIVKYLRQNPDMVHVPLLECDWVALGIYVKILAVPHAFQQVLGAEKIPTLCDILPSFNTMIQAWRKLQLKFPAYSMVIEAGITKLVNYQCHISHVPAYLLAILINPCMKLNWFKENMPGRVEEIQDLFIKHLEPYHEATTGSAAPMQSNRSQAHISDDDDDPNVILGLQNLHLTHSRGDQSLCAEVEAYFLDTQVASSSLLFWQMLKYTYDHGGEELNFTQGLSRDEEVEYLLHLDHNSAPRTPLPPPNPTKILHKSSPYPDVFHHPAIEAYMAAHPHHTIPQFGLYLLLQTLGEGEFGKVKLGIHVQWGEEVAVKLIHQGNVDTAVHLSKVEREIEVLRMLKHPNIVCLYDVIETDKYIGIILEYASGGELFDHILAHHYLKERDAAKLFSQLISGVWYIHQKKIVHRDLKLENLLLDRNRNVIITDFGFANRFEHKANDLMQTSCGSPCYPTPELIIKA